jgi:hypothetical protein
VSGRSSWKCFPSIGRDNDAKVQIYFGREDAIPASQTNLGPLRSTSRPSTSRLAFSIASASSAQTIGSYPTKCPSIPTRYARYSTTALTSAAVVRPSTSLLRDRFSAGQGARNPSTGMCEVPCRREAALGSKRPRSRGKSVFQTGPWN